MTEQPTSEERAAAERITSVLDACLRGFNALPAEIVTMALLLRGVDALKRLHGNAGAARQLREVADLLEREPERRH